MSTSTVEELAELIGTINYDISCRDWFGLDQRLTNLDTDNPDKAYIIAFLRSTSPVQTKLECWDDAVDRARVSFGQNEKLLKGLY